MFVFFNCQQLLPSLTKLINLSSFLCVPKIKSLINMIKLFIYLYVLKLVYTFTTFSTTIFLPTTNYQLLLISYFLFLTSYSLPLTPSLKRLHIAQPLVIPIKGNQFFMFATFNNFSFVENTNFVGTFDGRKTVSYYQGGTVKH